MFVQPFCKWLRKLRQAKNIVVFNCPLHWTAALFWYLTTHTNTHLTALCPWLTGRAGTRKVRPIRILLKQETVCDSGICWAERKSAPRSRQITMPAPHRSVFLQAGCPSCCPTNSVKALKALLIPNHDKNNSYLSQQAICSLTIQLKIQQHQVKVF